MSNVKQMLSAATQKKDRPPIETICHYLITEPKFKDGMEKLLAVFAEYKIKPAYSGTSTYAVKYKKKSICSIKIGDGAKLIPNKVVFRVGASTLDDIDAFSHFITDDVLDLYITNFKECHGCGHNKPTAAPLCRPAEFSALLFQGKVYHNLCNNSTAPAFLLDANTTTEQFDVVVKYLRMKIETSENLQGG